MSFSVSFAMCWRPPPRRARRRGQHTKESEAEIRPPDGASSLFAYFAFAPSGEWGFRQPCGEREACTEAPELGLGTLGHAGHGAEGSVHLMRQRSSTVLVPSPVSHEPAAVRRNVIDKCRDRPPLERGIA